MSGEALPDLLVDAQARGFLGPGPIEPHLAHAEAFAELAGPPPAAFLDLGSGGGLPGLVLAARWPTASGVLLDAAQRRCEWLSEALLRAGCSARVTVRCGRAEDLAREPELREAFPVVTARSFGPPAVTAECGVGFVAPGGRLVVSEPPEDASGDATTRWPAEELGRLGLAAPELVRHRDAGAVVLQRTGALSERWPRRTGVPAKRPLWKAARPASDR